MANNPQEVLEEWLVQEWSTHFAQAIESMTGEPPESSYARSTSQAEPEIFWWEQTFSSPAGALAWVGAPAASWKEIGERVLKSAGVEDGDADSIKSTYQELVNQSLSGLGQSITNRLRREVTCVSGREAIPPTDQAVFFAVTLRFSGQNFPLFAALGPKLVESLQVNEASTPEPPKPTAEKAPEPPAAAARGSHNARSIDLLLDVELPIGVSFGRAELPLKDVIKLTTGSIVELNRSVSEPVEIIVNNCVIARGQVVVVEGNFGVRIQQVISRQERIRTLK